MATKELTKGVTDKLKAPTASGQQELAWDEEPKGSASCFRALRRAEITRFSSAVSEAVFYVGWS